MILPGSFASSCLAQPAILLVGSGAASCLWNEYMYGTAHPFDFAAIIQSPSA
jgi:hypothetical protein